MNKILITCIIASILLTGCGKSDRELKQESQAQAWQNEQLAQAKAQQAQQEAQQAAQTQQQADDQELVGIIAELKKGDPLVKDAYYGYNEKGDRVLHVVRDNPPQQQTQNQPQYQPGSNSQPIIINNQPAQQVSGGVSESIWPLAAGVGAGMLLAHAMNSGGGYQSWSGSHQPYSSHNYSQAEYHTERNTVVNNYHTTVYKNATESAKPVGASRFTQTKTLDNSSTRPIASNVVPPKVTGPVNSYWAGAAQKPVTTQSTGSVSNTQTRPLTTHASTPRSFGSPSPRSFSSGRR